jgi:hypothetical protein
MCNNVLKFGMAACVLVGLGAVSAEASRGYTGDRGSRDVSPFVTVRPLRLFSNPAERLQGLRRQPQRGHVSVLTISGGR